MSTHSSSTSKEHPMNSGTTSRLWRRERPAAAIDRPDGLLVLLHGRGADGDDLFPLLDILDPAARLHAVTLQAPAQLPGQPGYHWYEVHRVGHPHEESFTASLALLHQNIAALLQDLDLDQGRLVIGGFSQGSVMATAAAVGAGGIRPAGLLCWSGFVPQVRGWQLDRTAAADLPVVLTHGSLDPVIDVSFGRAVRESLTAAGAAVDWREPRMGHELDPQTISASTTLIDRVIPPHE